MLENAELEQLNKGWYVIMIIWGALLGSLAVYLIICKVIEGQLKVAASPDFPVEAIKYALYGISVLTLVSIFYLRKALLKLRSDSISNLAHTSRTPQHPAVGKYTIAIVITMALSESIGIYGVVLFFLSKDSMMLYQLLIISAAAMYYFRPRKEELLKLAEEMRQNENTQ